MSDTINQAVNAMLESFTSSESYIQHLDRQKMPSAESIIQAINVLQSLMFPGFFGERGLSREELRMHVATQMSWLHETLTAQIRSAFAHGNHLKEESKMSAADAVNVAALFLNTLPRIRAILATDVEAAYDGDPIAGCRDEVIVSYPSIYAVMTYRLAHELYKLNVPLIPRIMTEHAHHYTGIDIHPGTQIGEAFFIDHGTGVVIGGTAIIGNRVKIYQGVTLGAFSFPKDASGNLIRDTKRHPTIEDDVVIYSGATILGGDTIIGKGSAIGGNVWLTKSVPPYSKVAQDNPRLKIITPGTEHNWDYVI
jgi:serine O-acetyltransferase